MKAAKPAVRFALLFAFLLGIQAFLAAAPKTPSQQFVDFALKKCDDTAKNLPEIKRVAEIVARRHIAGGAIVCAWNYQGLQQELVGRSGGIMHFGKDGWGEPRTPELDKQNVAIIGWDRAPGANDLPQLKKLHEAGTYIIGFGPRTNSLLAEHVKLCDAFFDTGFGDDDRVAILQNGNRAGHGNLLANMLSGWAFTAELVAALTRQGKMPTMWKSWMYPDGHEWSDKYYSKKQWHDDYQIAAIKPYVLSRAYLKEIRENIGRFQKNQNENTAKAVEAIVAEMKAGRKAVVATQGHAPWTYVGYYEDARWGTLSDFDAINDQQAKNHQEKTPDEALVLRLGYTGLNEKEAAIFCQKKQRVLLISTPSPRPEFKIPDDIALFIDMGWEYGDACVSIANYPIKILPPSGIMQIVAYESINTEVLNRLD